MIPCGGRKDARFYDVADAALARGRALRRGGGGGRLRCADNRRAQSRRLRATRPCRARDPTDRADALDRRRLPAQSDDHGEPGLGPAGELERAVRARAREPGQRPQRAPVRNCLEPAGTTAARLCPGVARDLALLGDRRKLDYRGEHYKLTLMTPDFSPEPT